MAFECILLHRIVILTHWTFIQTSSTVSSSKRSLKTFFLTLTQRRPIMAEAKILIIDLGSQYTLVIERTLRELGYRSAVLSPGKAKDWIADSKPKCIILSGGSDSIYDDNAPQPPAEILSLGIPILGICYGMHWLVTAFNGVIQSETQKREYGKTAVNYFSDSPLLLGILGEHTAWASHGDSVKKLPPPTS